MAGIESDPFRRGMDSGYRAEGLPGSCAARFSARPKIEASESGDQDHLRGDFDLARARRPEWLGIGIGTASAARGILGSGYLAVPYTQTGPLILGSFPRPPLSGSRFSTGRPENSTFSLHCHRLRT